VHRYYPRDRSDCGLELITLVMQLRGSEQRPVASAFYCPKEPEVRHFADLLSGCGWK